MGMGDDDQVAFTGAGTLQPREKAARDACAAAAAELRPSRPMLWRELALDACG